MLTQWYRQQRGRRPPLRRSRAWRFLRRYHDAVYRLRGSGEIVFYSCEAYDLHYQTIHSGQEWLWQRVLARAGGTAASTGKLRNAVAGLAREIRRFP